MLSATSGFGSLGCGSLAPYGASRNCRSMKFKIVNYYAHRISGWVYEPDAGLGNAVLDLVVNGETVSALTCNIFRDELSAEEFSTRNVGFLGNLPPQFWTGEEHDVALIHRGTGDVLTEKRISTADSRIAGTEDLSANFMLTPRGQVAGWASAENRPAYARVTVDGKVIDQARTDRRVLPWKRDALKFNAPFGYMHGTQIPSDFFDGQVHRVQIFAGGDPHAPVPVLDQTLELAAEHSAAAAREAQRLQHDEPNASSTWLKPARVRSEIRVARVALTECYASITLTGETQRRRLVLRLGEAEVILTALTEPPEGYPAAEGTQRYAGEIPLEGRFTDSIPLFTAGTEVGSTYDLRLGDTTGRRPAGLPETIVQDTRGEFLLSETVLDGGVFTGWTFHTAGFDFPVEVVLREITETGETEVHRTPATLKNKQAKLQHGIPRAGYALVLPSSVLVRRSAHLRLLAVHGQGERVLWEDRSFHAANHFLSMADLLETIVAGMNKVASVIESNAGYDHILGDRLDKPEYLAIAANSSGALIDIPAMSELFTRSIHSHRPRVFEVPEALLSSRLLSFGSTANNRREILHLKEMFERSHISLEIPNLCDFRHQKSDSEFIKLRETICLGFDQFVSSRSGITRGLLHQLLNYGRFFLAAYETLGKSSSECFVVANDHSPAPVAYAKVASYFEKKVIYIQHAEVTKNFPVLDFDLSILRNRVSKEIYSTIGSPKGKVLISPRSQLSFDREEIATIRASLMNTDAIPAYIYPTSVSSVDEVSKLYESLEANPHVSRTAVKLHPSVKDEDLYLQKGMQVEKLTPTYAHLAVCGNSSVAIELLASGSLVYQCFDLDQIAPDYYGFVQQGLVQSLTSAEISLATWRPGNNAPAAVPVLDDYLPNPKSTEGITEYLRTKRLLLESTSKSPIEVELERRMRNEENLLRDVYCRPLSLIELSRSSDNLYGDDWWVIGVLDSAFHRRDVHLLNAYDRVCVDSADSVVEFWLVAKAIEWTGRTPTVAGIRRLTGFVLSYNLNIRAKKWLESKMFDLLMRFAGPRELIDFMGSASYVSTSSIRANKSVAFYRYMNQHPEWHEQLRSLHDPESHDQSSLDSLKVSVQGLRRVGGELEYDDYRTVEEEFLRAHPVISKEYQELVQSIYGDIGHRAQFIDVERDAYQRSEVLNLIRQKLANRDGFSFVRLSDGEGIIFQEYSRFFTLQDSQNRQRHWWGQEIPSGTLDGLITDLQESVREADMLGIPSVYRFLRDHSHRTKSLSQTIQGRGLLSVLQGVPHYDDGKKMYTDDKANIVLFNELETIRQLSGLANRLIVVSSGSRESVYKVFGDFPAMLHIPVPTHNKTRSNPKYQHEGRSLPFVYQEIDQYLASVASRGDLVLVGAGVAGKVFVRTARRQGCVGLDIGSAMDQLLKAGIHSLF